jgi:hypothetical protein
LIDSGTSYYSASKRFIKRLTEVIKFNKLCQNYYSYPDITLALNSSKYSKLHTSPFNLTLTADDYITKQKMNVDISLNKEFFSMDYCEMDFISYSSMDDKNLIILGLKFLRKYYTIFDYERKIIGFNEYTPIQDTISYNDMVKQKDELEVLFNDWVKIFG